MIRRMLSQSGLRSHRQRSLPLLSGDASRGSVAEKKIELRLRRGLRRFWKSSHVTSHTRSLTPAKDARNRSQTRTLPVLLALSSPLALPSTLSPLFPCFSLSCCALKVRTHTDSGLVPATRHHDCQQAKQDVCLRVCLIHKRNHCFICRNSLPKHKSNRSRNVSFACAVTMKVS